ncbi:MAG: ABC transporter ATP-binding protein [Chloroflexi bacterium]|nr:ABC transporter ATP-binding protein [Chloroflexota bacterium]
MPKSSILEGGPIFGPRRGAPGGPEGARDGAPPGGRRPKEIAEGDGKRGSGGSDGKQRGRGPGRPGPSGPVRPILLRLLGYMRPHALKLLGIVLAVVATTAIELAPPWVIRFGVDRLILGGETGRIWWLAGGLIGLALLQGLVDFVRLYATAAVGQRIVFDLRNAVFEHLSQLSFSFYDQARTGDLMSRVTADVDVLSDFFGRAAVVVLSNLLTLLGILVILALWDWRLALIYLFFVPLMVHGMIIYARQVQPAMARARRKLADLTAVLQQILAGIEVVKLFGRERFEQSRVDRESAALRQANIETTRISSLWMPYANILVGIGTGLVLWFGGLSVIGGIITLGTLVGFTTYISMLLRPIRQTGMMLNVVLRSLAAAERVFEMLDIKPDIQDVPGAYPLPPVRGHIRYEGVRFAYRERDEVLRGIDLEAQPGEMVALVGPSGSGKTTLVHLLPRFYDPQAGRITIDGHDIHQVTVKSLRDAIGIALQSVFLFDASLAENIAYGNPEASRERIEWAAKVVQMHDFIASLPLGYDTPVGERGVRLSGGQKQRIALARVLLRDPRILIMDEPTSSVDADTERRMQQALQAVRRGRTTFVIAHRLWTVQQADQILVLREGRIVERARSTVEQSAHEALLALGGYYRALYDLQFRGERLQVGDVA